MKILVFGGRDQDEFEVCDFLLFLHANHALSDLQRGVEGGALGADRGGRRFFCTLCIPFDTFKADWNQFGRAAGPIRNEKMIKESKPDIAICFPGGTGTAHMLSLCKKYGVKTILIKKNEKGKYEIDKVLKAKYEESVQTLEGLFYDCRKIFRQ